MFPGLHIPFVESHQNGFVMETAVVRMTMLPAGRVKVVLGIS
jgi:hypothetical protein